MTAHRLGYVGVEHHHRDPYFAIASTLPIDLVAICEPGKSVPAETLSPMGDRPDEIVAGTDDPTTLASGATSYADPARLIEEEALDVLWITYSNKATPTIIEKAVNAGLDVIVEKPAARTADAFRELARRADRRNVAIVPTYFYRANPILRELKSLVNDGFFGDLWALEGRFVGSQLEYRNTDHYLYEAEESRGGVLQWIGVHWLDLMTVLLETDIVRLSARMSDPTAGDIEAGAMVQFETASGTMGSLTTGYFLDDTGKDAGIRIYGTDGQAWSPVHHDATSSSAVQSLELLSGSKDWEPAPRRRREYEFSYERFPAWGDWVLRFFEETFAGLEAGEVPADQSDALRILTLLDAAYESAASGESVELPER